MTEQDAKFAVAGEPCRLNEPGVPAHVGFGARDADIKREVHDCRRQHDVLHRIAERGDDAHRENEQRKRHDGIGDTADDTVRPAAEESCGDAGEPAHQECQRNR